MARIMRNTGEKVFNISRWHGVNEAPEGEASLKLGEAAEMRNFCVTSGGALKKRPGSRNVAGLLSRYAARVREGEARLLITDVGVGEGYEMYPRIAADDVGTVRCAGAPVKVNGANAGEYAGYFYEKDGACWELDRVERSGSEGSEPISGGSATPGALTQIGSGRVKKSASGTEGTGDQYVDTYPEAYVEFCPEGTRTGVRGQVIRREAPKRQGTGWDSQNAGGYFMRDGRLWKYYGARVDGFVPEYGWKKYRCTVSTVRRTNYTEGYWELVASEPVMEGEASGYLGYEFDESTGRYTTTGSWCTLTANRYGAVYIGGGSSITRTWVDQNGISIHTATARGPYTSSETSYAVGAYVGSAASGGDARPDSDRGYSFVTQFMSGGETYTVMRDGQDYYCYARDTLEAAGYSSSFSFHANPLEVSADTYRWYFNETYSQAEEAGDRQVRGIWSGFVTGREVLCAVCGGTLWELREEDGRWEKISAGELDTSGDVHMFGFDEKLYILGGGEYLVWDGERLSRVEGYRPLVAVSTVPEGGGTLLEGVNRLSAGRRCWFSPDGEATVFQLPETDIGGVDWVRAPGTESSPFGSYSVDEQAGTVTFETAPARGINSLEIGWSAKEDLRAQVCGMRFAEVFNGAQDSRVFLYGDGSNRAVYSGLDYDGRPRADYFPDLYEVAVGDANTPLTSLIRHYNKLMAFKADSAWSIGYDVITLADGTVTAGFCVTPVNRSVGNCAPGQAQLVLNRPRTLDGRSVIEWRATGSGGNITGDQRNAERVSQRVDNTIRRFDLTRARTFYDKFSHEYFVIGEDGTAIVQNLDVDAWYVYTGLDATCMINYRDELYYGTRDGYLRHFSDRYLSDNGEAIDAVWESGAMSMGEDFRRKYSAMVWIGIKPEDNGYLEVTAQTDRRSELAVYDLGSGNASGVPETERVKLKAKRFTYYKLILRNNTADRTVTVVSADMRVRGSAYVR